MTKETNLEEKDNEKEVKDVKKENRGKMQNNKAKRSVGAKKELQRNKDKATKKTAKRRTDPKVNDSEYDFKFKKGKLKIIPLGGLEEIGKNITVFEYEDDIILVDCGLEFPEDSMLGVDMVIPDVTYLERNKEKLRTNYNAWSRRPHRINTLCFTKS